MSLSEEYINGKEAGLNEMLVVVFERGRFLTSPEIGLVTREKNEYYTFTQEVVDKAEIKHIINCTNYKDDEVKASSFI